MTRHHVRWMILRDMPEVLEMDRQGYPRTWGEPGFHCILRQRNVIGMVAEQGEWVVGFMVYELLRDRINVLRFAVADDRRREGVGSAMVAKLKGKLTPHRRNRITFDLPEINASLGACGFLASHGFQATLDRSEEPHVYRFEHALQMEASLCGR